MNLQTPIKVLLVDDHPLVRLGLAHLIASQAGLEVCAQASTAVEVVGLIDIHDPDVVVLDLMLGQDSGLELLKSLLQRFSHLQVLVLSMHDQRVYAERCLRAGAKGYLMKHEAAAMVVQALLAVAAGEVFLSPSLHATANTTLTPLTTLSDREMRVFELIGNGLPTRAIAAVLALSDKTVETHKANIKRKLGLTHGMELVRLASDWQSTGGSGNPTRRIPVSS
jgi:DNA-binding NarL/FixJ family response regulator